MNWLKEAELALKAAATSAELVESKFTGAAAVKTKESRRDVVTELDTIVERNIIDTLKTSGYDIVGEETAAHGCRNTPPEKPTWFVDPIDGTANLVSSIPFYAISVGLVKMDDFLIGAVVLPAMKEIFFTFGDQGAFLNGARIRVKQAALEDSLIAASFSGGSDDDGRRKREFASFGEINDASRGCLRLGSASVNICYAAANRLQGAYGIHAKIWDVAGALAVASQAGCKIYVEWIEKTNLINYVAGAPRVADAIAKYVKKQELANVEEISGA